MSAGKSSITDPADVRNILDEVRRLIEHADVTAAREILATAYERGLRSKQLDHWRKVLAPPKTWSTGQASGGGMSEVAVWLKNNGAVYQGQWVALKDDTVIGADASRVRLQQMLKDAGKLENTVFLRL